MGHQREENSGRRNSQSLRRRGVLILLSVLIVVLLGITSLANRWKGDLQVERLDIRGNRILGGKEIASLARIPVGSPLYDVDLLEVRNRLKMNPYVGEAIVVHDLPSTIKVTIKERTPVAIVGGPELFYISAEGYVLPAVSSKEIFDLPVITGLAQQPPIKAGVRITTENFWAAMEILSVAATLYPELYHLLSEINVTSSDPVVYTAEQGIPILFGKENIRNELIKLESFWNQYMRQQSTDRLRSIDLRFDGQVVVAWTKSQTQEQSL